MGTIRTGANGGFSGKAGSITGSSWPDIFTSKACRKSAISQSQKTYHHGTYIQKPSAWLVSLKKEFAGITVILFIFIRI